MTTHPDETFAQVSAAPTRAGTGAARTRLELDVDQLFAGADATTGPVGPALDEKLRQAYFWMVNHGIISPHYDVEFHDPDRPRTTFRLGDSKAEVDLPTDQSYSSFVLLPLLTFAVRGRCLLVGGPGRGKTASAVLMGVLAGYPVREVRRAMQHGHPQLTVQDIAVPASHGLGGGGGLRHRRRGAQLPSLAGRVEQRLNAHLPRLDCQPLHEPAGGRKL